MKTVLLLPALLMMAGAYTYLHAQSKPKLVVLPFRAIGVDSNSTQTLIAMLRQEIEQKGKAEVVETGRTPGVQCDDIACATEAAKRLFAERVVYGRFSTLGSKVVMDYSVAEVESGRRLVSDNVTAGSLELLQPRLADVAASISGGQPIADLPPSTPTVTPQRVLNRKYDTVSIGVGVGQLYPQSGYLGASSRVFVLDSRVALERGNYSFNLVTAIRYGLMINFGASYIPLKGSVTPYFGGGVGYHLVAADLTSSQFRDNEIIASGFQAMISAGMWFLRTNDIRIFLNLDYMYTASSFDDKAIVLTLGVAGITDAISF